MCTCAPRDWRGLLLQDVSPSLSPAANPASFVHAGRWWHQCQQLQPMGQHGGICSLQPDDNFHTDGVPVLLNQSDGGVLPWTGRYDLSFIEFFIFHFSLNLTLFTNVCVRLEMVSVQKPRIWPINTYKRNYLWLGGNLLDQAQNH